MITYTESVPAEIERLYRKLQDNIFPDEKLFVRRSTSAPLIGESWWEIGMVRGDYEGMIVMDATDFLCGKKTPALAEMELEWTFWLKWNELSGEME